MQFSLTKTTTTLQMSKRSFTRAVQVSNSWLCPTVTSE